jgi:hypothetical protein
MVRVPINALREKDGRVSMLWRIRIAPRGALIAAACTLLVLLAAGLPLRAAAGTVILALIAIGLFAIVRARRISSIVKSCVSEVASQLQISAIEDEA